nr:hypothetical protein [Morchella crassipes]
MGLIIEPWGVLTIECWYTANSKYPAFRALIISLMNLSSLILFLISLIRTLCSKESKHLEMSPSIYQVATPNFSLTSRKAVWQPLPVLKPWLWGEKVGSNMASSIILITSWTSLSNGGATVRGIVPALALGIWTLLPGLKLNLSVLIRLTISSIVS